MSSLRPRPLRSGFRRAPVACLLFLGLAATSVAAQVPNRPEQLCGFVRHGEDGEPLAAVVVRVAETGGGAITDASGRFCLQAPGIPRIGLRAERIGFASTEHVVERGADGALPDVEIRMAVRAVELPGIAVLPAEGARDGAPGSSSRIERAAIEHLQASSIADVLQLLPGQIAGPPSLADPRQVLLRQVPTTAAATRAAALGTALVVDGAPVSNNANLQSDVTILNSGPGSLPPFASTAGRGVDLRRISPDEIESIEVIRGIPSARHGDLTAGAILVQSRIGARTPELRLRVNPTLVDLSATAGWGDGLDRSGWSVTAVATSSQDDPRQPLEGFRRGTLGVGWRNDGLRDGGLRTALHAQAFGTVDELRVDPSRPAGQNLRRARESGLRVTWRGTLRRDATSETTLNWTASGSIEEQSAFYQGLVNRSITPISTAYSDTTLVGIYGPSEYLNHTTVHGRPIHGYLRIEGERPGGLAGIRLRSLVGLELRHDGNRGRGRQFDLLTPPRQNYSVGDRPRSYRDIPAVQVLSLFAETHSRTSVGPARLQLQTGLRFDNVNPTGLTHGRFGTELQPRINLEVAPLAESLPELTLRAGAGRMSKAPPLAFLFPGPRYFDLVNLNYFHPNPAERLLILTTRVVHPSNEGARSYTSRKVEGGVSWRSRRSQGPELHLTAFEERTRGAYGWQRELVSFPVERYGIAATPPGRPPELAPEPIAIDTFFSAYDVPAATQEFGTRGLELTLDLPEWEPVATSVSVTGGWFRTRAQDRAPQVDTWAFLSSAQIPARAGVYPAPATRSERATTTVYLIHRAPGTGLVVTAALQTIWTERDRPVGLSPFPIAYVTRAADLVPLTPEEARSEAYSDLHRSIAPDADREERRPPLSLVNLRISKALPGDLEMSVFLNNALSHRPLYERRRGGGFQQRNPPLFFGAELSGRIGGGR